MGPNWTPLLVRIDQPWTKSASLPGGTRPDTPHHHVALWLRATVEMRLRRVYAQGGVWRMCGRGRAGVQQERTAQYGGRMFVFATTQGVQGEKPSAIARGGSEKIPKVGSHRGEREGTSADAATPLVRACVILNDRYCGSRLCGACESA